MKILFKFKDGQTITIERNEFKNTNILEYLIAGKQGNEAMTFKIGDQEIERKFGDLSSVEFLF